MTTTAHFMATARDDRSGKLDANLIARAFGLSGRELALVLERDPAGLKRHPTSAKLQPQLERLERLALHLTAVFGNLELGRKWLRAPNPVLGGEAPLKYLLNRQPVAIERLLIMAETGMPT